MNATDIRENVEHNKAGLIDAQTKLDVFKSIVLKGVNAAKFIRMSVDDKGAWFNGDNREVPRDTPGFTDLQEAGSVIHKRVYSKLIIEIEYYSNERD